MKKSFRENAKCIIWTELEPCYTNAKSFYGKAEIEFVEKDNIKVYNLFSYKKNVARIIVVGSTYNAICFGKYSNTTTRHQKEFFKQFGFEDEEIKELFNSAFEETDELQEDYH